MNPSPGPEEFVASCVQFLSIAWMLFLILAAIFAASFAYVVLGLFYFRLRTGRWVSHESERFLGVDTAYSDLPPPVEIEVAHGQPIPQVAKKTKKKPLPIAEPPRPNKKLRVRVIEGSRSRVRGRYYIDEDSCDPRLIELLRKHGLDITTTYEEHMKQANDQSQLAHATADRRMIVTCDGDFIALHKQGVAHAGIIRSPKGKIWFQEILRICLRLAGEVAEV